MLRVSRVFTYRSKFTNMYFTYATLNNKIYVNYNLICYE